MSAAKKIRFSEKVSSSGHIRRDISEQRQTPRFRLKDAWLGTPSGSFRVEDLSLGGLLLKIEGHDVSSLVQKEFKGIFKHGDNQIELTLQGAYLKDSHQGLGCKIIESNEFQLKRLKKILGYDDFTKTQLLSSKQDILWFKNPQQCQMVFWYGTDKKIYEFTLIIFQNLVYWTPSSGVLTGKFIGADFHPLSFKKGQFQEDFFRDKSLINFFVERLQESPIFNESFREWVTQQLED